MGSLHMNSTDRGPAGTPIQGLLNPAAARLTAAPLRSPPPPAPRAQGRRVQTGDSDSPGRRRAAGRPGGRPPRAMSDERRRRRRRRRRALLGPRFPLRGSRAPGAPCLGGAARLRGSGSARRRGPEAAWPSSVRQSDSGERSGVRDARARGRGRWPPSCCAAQEPPPW